jgi:hypothetical protein
MKKIQIALSLSPAELVAIEVALRLRKEADEGSEFIDKPSLKRTVKMHAIFADARQKART